MTSVLFGAGMDGVMGGVPQYMEPGDVLLFVDCVTHGGERKITPGVSSQAIRYLLVDGSALRDCLWLQVRRTIWYR